MKTIFSFLLVVLFTLLEAQSIEPGVFEMEGGNYSVSVKFQDSSIEVTEPNRVTSYTLLSGNKYQYYHEEFQKTYYVEIMDPNTLSFTSSNTSGATILKRSSQTLKAASKDYDRYMAIANKYKEMAENDADDDMEVQAYTFCSVSALAGAMKTEKEFIEYASQVALTLKTILVNPNKNPCQDAIPAAAWNSAKLD